MALGLTIAGWFAPELIRKFISMFFTYAGDQYNRNSDLKQDLEQLQKSHPKIQVLVSAAKQSRIRDSPPGLRDWFLQLRDASDEAEDLLDEFHYMQLEQQARANNSKVRDTASRFKKIMKRAVKIDPTLERLKLVVKKMDAIAADADLFLKLVEQAATTPPPSPHLEAKNGRETSSMLSVPPGKVFGREQEILELIEHLQSSQLGSCRTDLTVLHVVGMGGIGKTTLVQYVYNDKSVEEYFDIRMWVCVSDVSDVTVLTRKILESATGLAPQVSSLDMLQRSLEKELTSKRFLLVLDDVWNDMDWSLWERLFAPLRFGHEDSKIVVTTRIETVAKRMKGAVNAIVFKGLSDDDCWLLLKERSFNKEDPDCYPELHSIGRRIAKKLKGSPLAAKTLGGLLRSNLDEEHWRCILGSDMLDLEQGENDIMPILSLSYRNLPPHLQSCFAYCSIFPQDHCFLKKDLVQMWIAAGLIQEPPRAKETMEDVAYKYLEDLLKKSFFDDHMDTGDYLVMHDLLHDLARLVSSGECLRVATGEVAEILSFIRHLSLTTDDSSVIEKLSKVKHLRTLHLSLVAYDPTFYCYDTSFYCALKKLFQSLKGLRVLKLSSEWKVKLPNAIGNLIHLRYLNLSGVDSIQLPESLSRLYHLQVLAVGERPNYLLESIPEGLNYLINLRHVRSSYLVSMIPGIGRLASLQELSEFIVKRERGYSIRELKSMTEFRELGIESLEHVASFQEACEAKINEKECLDSLVLKWGWNADIGSPQLDEQVLYGLQPHANLKNLTIEYHRGFKPPTWMTGAIMSNLKCLYLNSCKGWEHLPPLWELPHLRVLHLHQMPALKRFGNRSYEDDQANMFPSLKELRIEEMPELAEWDNGGLEGFWFPCLHELSIKICPKLRELPALPPSLVVLDLKGVGLLTLPQWPWDSRRSSVLRFLFLQDCMELMSLGGSESLLYIKRLRITGCPILSAAPLPATIDAEEGFSMPIQLLIVDYASLIVILPFLMNSITSLQTLRIYNCSNINMFPAELEEWLLQNSELQELELYGADSLQALPVNMHRLSSLRSFYLAHAYELESLPDLPASLEQLNFFDCRVDTDTYQSKIAHIRNVCSVLGGSRCFT